MEHEPSRSGQDTRPHTSELADQIVDELMPGDLDWRHLVRSYPFPVVLLAIVTGFFLGHRRGHLLLSALGGFAAHQATERIATALEHAGVATPSNERRAAASERDF